MKEVYVVVVSNHEFYYDDGQASHLPRFRPVLGVYDDFNSAHGKVYNTFCGENSDIYEELRVDGNSYEYKYTDKTHGGYVIYTVEVCKKHIEETD